MNIDKKAAASAIEAFLRAIGRDPAREPELVGTGERVAAAFVDELLDGYAVDPAALLARHKIEPASGDLVVMRDALVTTTCPHHLMPAKGMATVAFAPRGAIVGLGALVQLLDACAHRLTLQEQIGERVVAALEDALAPAWAGCRLVLEHTCVVARGERRHGARVETVALSGALAGDGRSAAERALGVGR
jgi:GTP cyclohydrolase I